MRLGVAAALHSEVGRTLRALGTVRRDAGSFTWHESPGLVFTVSGVGARRAAAAAQALLQATPLDGLLSIGFCGAIVDGLSPGDLILGGTTGHEASPELLALAGSALPHRAAPVTTVDRVLLEPGEKERVARETGAVAVDMESAAVAQAARERGLPFLSAKVVIDTPRIPLASRYESILGVTLEILRRPWILARVLGDLGRVRRASGVFRKFFVHLALALGEPGPF